VQTQVLRKREGETGRSFSYSGFFPNIKKGWLI
jgi:hypothetical protein